MIYVKGQPVETLWKKRTISGKNMTIQEENREKNQNMSYNEKRVNRERKMMFYLLAICVLGAGFTPYTRIFLGLLLGSSISFYNLWLLQTKVKNIAEAMEKDQTPKGLGTISRFASAVFGVMIAVHFDEYFELISFIIGLMTSYFIMVIDFIIAKRADSA